MGEVETKDGCLFCAIATGKVASQRVFEDDEVVAFHDVNPQAPVHVLLIPRRHVGSVNELAAGDGPLLATLFATAARLAGELGVADSGYRLVTNTGPDAGQSVGHLHFHLLAGRRLAWPPG